MAISFVSAETTIQNSGTTITVNKPAGVVSGDLMIAQFYVEGSSIPTITPPAGWTSKATATGTNTRSQVFTKVAGASEPAGYAFTSSPSLVAGSGAICAYRATGTIVEAADAFVADATAPIDAPSVTTTRPNAKLFCGFTTVAIGSGVSGMTSRVALDNGSRDIAAFDQDIASSGATGTRTYTGSGVGWGYSLAIEEISGNRIRMMI